jgi:hypothetical protein
MSDNLRTISQIKPNSTPKPKKHTFLAQENNLQKMYGTKYQSTRSGYRGNVDLFMALYSILVRVPDS